MVKFFQKKKKGGNCYGISLLPSGVNSYLSSTCFTNPALTSSLSPLRTLNMGLPVALETASGVKGSFFKADKVVMPLLVGLPSGETHGITITAS
jgi:hypothetical protein